jgi:hypothetical protein
MRIKIEALLEVSMGNFSLQISIDLVAISGHAWFRVYKINELTFLTGVEIFLALLTEINMEDPLEGLSMGIFFRNEIWSNGILFTVLRFYQINDYMFLNILGDFWSLSFF